MKGSIMFKTLMRAISVASESLFLCKNLQMDLCGEKTCLRGFANKTDAYQPEHLRSLISAFVIRFVVRIICKLATGEFQFSSQSV